MFTAAHEVSYLAHLADTDDTAKIKKTAILERIDFLAVMAGILGLFVEMFRCLTMQGVVFSISYFWNFMTPKRSFYMPLAALDSRIIR